ncbi:hypothetical protein BGZ74_006673 [Mortierella antarctica]|nr:hypothetical protein BGZ74_006673 [Mortierella antarctica]
MPMSPNRAYDGTQAQPPQHQHQHQFSHPYRSQPNHSLEQQQQQQQQLPSHQLQFCDPIEPHPHSPTPPTAMGDDDAQKYRCDAMHEIQKLRQELSWVMGQYRALAESTSRS